MSSPATMNRLRSGNRLSNLLVKTQSPSASLLLFLLFTYLLVSCFITHIGPFHSPHSKDDQVGVKYKKSLDPAFSAHHNHFHDYPDRRNPPSSIYYDHRKQRPYEGSSGQRDDSNIFNAIVFDAGSTGTRIHIFKFASNTHSDGYRRLSLLNQNFKQIKPGLSAYAEDPKKAVESILPLLSLASDEIPTSARSRTLLVVKATAGLRLLPKTQADAILQAVSEHLRSINPPYALPKHAVSIMDGEDEGVFGWYTINFLLETLNDLSKSVSLLDLGGGSTQITFYPNSEGTFRDSPDGYIMERNILGQQIKLYTHSYLGFGLLSSRKGTLMRALKPSQDVNAESFYIEHPCFPAGSKISWNFESREYVIYGVDGDCFSMTKDYVNNVGGAPIFHSPPELEDEEIYAISYFYDRAVDVGMVNDSQSFGFLRVKDFYLAAQRVCGPGFHTQNLRAGASTLYPDGEFQSIWAKYNGLSSADFESLYESNPFVCLDLSYITNLLSTGYRLGWEKKIVVIKKFNDVETSWALGAAASLSR